MISQKSGSIVNISSIGGIRAALACIGYVASKFAVTGMTKAAAIELARHNVRVNSIHPGMIDTDMIREVASGDQNRLDRLAGSVPMGRSAGPGEIASLALYLASEESSFSTGSEFIADGGVTAS
ncbi:MAG: 3alpha(or 20beta)-hydroxysteroid dehydrogenase [Acidimicrobiales bacterium]|jgi:3alpha(or 20beta)-hydroxysteroid dehydrogenase